MKLTSSVMQGLRRSEVISSLVSDVVGSLVGLTLAAISAARISPNLCNLQQQLSCACDKFRRRRKDAPSQEESFMADDMEKKNQQSGQSGQGQPGGQPGQHGQQGGQSGQYQPKKGGQTQDENEEDQNRDRQRRAS